MARKRVIVSIGEALLCEFPDCIEAGGLALTVAGAAVTAGHVGVCMSRVGQDAAGDDLMRQARGRGVDVDSMQSDPDLPTGRLVERSIGGRVTRSLTPLAAFDNLQWDFDMVDIAQHADAAVCGLLARRNGQSKSVIKQFLAECGSAIRVCDMTNRASDAIDRGDAASTLETCDVLIADAVALKALSPATSGEEAAAGAVARSGRLQGLVLVRRADGVERMCGMNADATGEWSAGHSAARHEAALVQVVLGMLAGADAPHAVTSLHVDQLTPR